MTASRIAKLPLNDRRLLSAAMNVSSMDTVVSLLLYNAIDAKATSIQVALDPFLYWVSVMDNGTGILPMDFTCIHPDFHPRFESSTQSSMVIEVKHCFPALSLLGDISTVTISSKHKTWHSRLKKCFGKDYPTPVDPVSEQDHSIQGTTVICSDLFYNIPVRRSQSNPRNIISAVRSKLEQLAVIYSHIAISLHDCNTNSVLFAMAPTQSPLQTLRHLSGDSAVPYDDVHPFQVQFHASPLPVSLNGWWFNSIMPQSLVYINHEPCSNVGLHNVISQWIKYKFSASKAGFICLVKSGRDMAHDLARIIDLINIETRPNSAKRPATPSSTYPKLRPSTAPSKLNPIIPCALPRRISQNLPIMHCRPLRHAHSSGSLTECTRPVSTCRSPSNSRRIDLSRILVDPRTGNSMHVNSVHASTSAGMNQKSHADSVRRPVSMSKRMTVPFVEPVLSNLQTAKAAIETAALYTRLPLKRTLENAHLCATANSIVTTETHRPIQGRLVWPRRSSLSRSDVTHLRVIAQVDAKYLLAVTDGPLDNASGNRTIVAIDQHAADERVRLEDLIDQVQTGSGLHPVPLNEHVRVQLSRPLARTHEDRLNWLKERCGIWSETEQAGEMDPSLPLETSSILDDAPNQVSDATAVIVQCIPEILQARLVHDTEAISTLLRDLLAVETTHLTASLIPSPIVHRLHSIACRSAIMFGDVLAHTTCQQLVSALSQTHMPFQCAHGRPSMVPLLAFSTQGGCIGSNSVHGCLSGRKRSKIPNWDKFSEKRQ